MKLLQPRQEENTHEVVPAFQFVIGRPESKAEPAFRGILNQTNRGRI